MKVDTATGNKGFFSDSQNIVLIIGIVMALTFVVCFIYMQYLDATHDPYHQPTRYVLGDIMAEVIEAKDPRSAFYSEMKEFIRENPGYALIYLSNSSGEIQLSVPDKWEGYTVKEMRDEVDYKHDFSISYDVYNFGDKMLKKLPGQNLHWVLEKEYIEVEYPMLDTVLNITRLALILYWLALAVWVYLDAKNRSYNPVLWGGLALITNLVGLIMYLMVRPDQKSCPQCFVDLYQEHKVCPYCGYHLKDICYECGSSIEDDWSYCAECGEKIN